MNAFVLLFPIIFLFVVHLITLLTQDLWKKKTEFIIILALLSEAIMAGTIANRKGEGVVYEISLTIFLLLWLYIYYVILST